MCEILRDGVRTENAPEGKGAQVSLHPSCILDNQVVRHLADRRRRLKELREPAYTVDEAERSAGLGKDDRQRGVEEIVRRDKDMEGDKQVDVTEKRLER